MEEEDNVQDKEPSRRTTRGPILVDVVTTRDLADRRPAKRRKVIEDSDVGQRPESRMAETQVTLLKMPKRRARPKKKANRRTEEARPLEVQMEALMKVEVKPSEERTAMVVVQVGGTVIDSPKVPSPPPPGKEVRHKEEKKASEEESKDLVVYFSDFLQDSMIPLLKYLYGKREKYVVSKEAGFYATIDLRDRLEISRVAFNKESRRLDELNADLAKRDHLHAAEEKGCRPEEKRKAEELWRRIVALKVERMELRGSIEARIEAHRRELQGSNELMANLVEQLRKHEVELANWAKKLTECESAKSLEVECRLDSQERRLMAMKTSGAAGHKQLIRLVNSFSSGLEEEQENLELEILSVLRRLRADGSSEDVVTAASDGNAPECSLPRAVEMSRSLE
ncbi:hypothetical protein AXG93_4863s1010 [Marchantia polymorpha subsp. ruderalis]|uniref:Uncharacterized protein n=1 Tax=Marchantia polymorpha subsp. ruderalis TaxID=1480154 RepID=A0A176VV00_MARPO|nr:hypothetical protein AXG93_4863s1010 [Marchantia polymorpha subsp. ruderalis]